MSIKLTLVTNALLFEKLEHHKKLFWLNKDEISTLFKLLNSKNLTSPKLDLRKVFLILHIQFQKPLIPF